MEKQIKEVPAWVKVAKQILSDKKKVHDVLTKGGDVKKIKGIKFVNPSKI